ncbi:MAG: hypothetical protein ABI905_09980 [Betaproteobacteria bacterium]
MRNFSKFISSEPGGVHAAHPSDTLHTLQQAIAASPVSDDEMETQCTQLAAPTFLFVAARLSGDDISGIPDSGSATVGDKSPAGRIRAGAVGSEAVTAKVWRT